MTINAVRLNALFEEYLKGFEYDQKHRGKLADIILERLKERLASKIEESTQLKKRISEIKGQLEGMEDRYVLGSLSDELYEKYATKYKEEIGRLEGELSKSSVQTSNLELL